MEKETLVALYEKHRMGRLAGDEKLLFETALRDPATARLLYEVLDEDWHTLREEDLQDVGETRAEEIYRSIIGHRTHRYRIWVRLAAAACILGVIVSGAILLSHPAHKTNTPVAVIVNDIPPGGDQAVLTLSNGQKIVLGSQRGRIAQQGQTGVTLAADGRIQYDAGATAGKEKEVLYNTLTVPIGNRRDIVLSDGTRVSLDAGTTITYPVEFAGATREVSMTGQAYFQVQHDPAHPFRVKAGNVIIKDIGTEFNVRAYEGESRQTATLFEGAVTVNDIGIVPGQQAVAAAGMAIEVKQADLEATGAWKNNDFLFRNEDLQTCMEQISRWYNIRVVYDNVPNGLRFRAAISRNRNLSAVLYALQEAGNVKFRLEGRTLTISQ